MIKRYTREKMGEIWLEEHRFDSWQKVEVAVLQAKQALQYTPQGIARRVMENTFIDVPRILEIEKTNRHEQMAFVGSIVEQLLAKRLQIEAVHYHGGLTSFDLVDPGLAMCMRDSLGLIDTDIRELLVVLRSLIISHKKTAEVGRTHGIHAEPISFGFKMANWYDELERHLSRISALKSRVAVGKISGAVGTYAHLDPRIEKIACKILGLSPARISTQIISRDRHAEYVSILAIIAGSLEKFATEIRNLQRTEIDEAMEPFKSGQKGSSAMPHKRNPVGCENICSLARIVRAFALVAMENQATWHERDLTNSANERIIIPDCSVLVDYMLGRFTSIMNGLVVKPNNMLRNLELTQGLIYSETVMLALSKKGMPREKAHDLVQELALLSLNERTPFSAVLRDDQRVTSVLSEEEIVKCFDLDHNLRNLETVFKRFPSMYRK